MAKLQKEISLKAEQKEIILKNLNEEGKLPCLKAFKVARKIGLESLEMSDACKSLDIKITDCELGVFGKLDFNNAEEEIYKNFEEYFLEEKDIECKVLWDLAQKSSLRRVGSTVKNSDAEVINCQLGCFKKRKGHREIKT